MNFQSLELHGPPQEGSESRTLQLDPAGCGQQAHAEDRTIPERERENKRLLQGRQKLINKIHLMRMVCLLQKVEFAQTFQLRIQADIFLTLFYFDTGRPLGQSEDRAWINRTKLFVQFILISFSTCGIAAQCSVSKMVQQNSCSHTPWCSVIKYPPFPSHRISLQIC